MNTISDPDQGINQETAKTYFWSRAPGRFVNKLTGQEVVFTAKTKEFVAISEMAVPNSNPRTVVRVLQEQEVEKVTTPSFHGTVRDWYETLVETITDAHNTLFRKNLQAPNILEVGPEVLTILEHTMAYKPAKFTASTPDCAEVSNGKFIGVLNNRLNVFRCDDMKNNEARVVLTSRHKFEIQLDPPKVPIVTLVDTKDSGTLKRLDQMSVTVLDMCLVSDLPA